VIGPRDLTQVLPERLGIGRLHWLATPPEMRFSDPPKAGAAALTGTDVHLAHHLPELVGKEIPRLLDAHPGLVVLVGAGLPGKLYCARVKALGGRRARPRQHDGPVGRLEDAGEPGLRRSAGATGHRSAQDPALSVDEASPAHRRSIEDALCRNGLDPERFCRPVPREDRAFFEALLPACGDDLSLALLRFAEAALREAGIVRRIAEGVFGGFDATARVLHAGSGWGRLTRVLAQRLPPGRLTASASRADTGPALQGDPQADLARLLADQSRPLDHSTTKRSSARGRCGGPPETSWCGRTSRAVACSAGIRTAACRRQVLSSVLPGSRS
jgi:hypothetical protein